MYGAIAKGRFAYSPIRSVPKMAVRMVAVREASAGMPAVFRMAGLTATMYAIVKKVVSPATTSRRTVVW